MDMGFGTWNVKSLYRVCSLKTEATVLAKYNLHVEVRWFESPSQLADDYMLFNGNGNTNRHLGTSIFVHKGIISAVKRVDFISDRMSFIKLRGHRCDIIVLNMYTSTEDKSVIWKAFTRN
jgi:hypothetical protein